MKIGMNRRLKTTKNSIRPVDEQQTHAIHTIGGRTRADPFAKSLCPTSDFPVLAFPAGTS